VRQLCNIYFATRPSPLLSLGDGGGWEVGGANKLLRRGGGGEGVKGEAMRGRKQMRWARPDGLAAQRENTVGAQSGGSRLVRDAEGGGR
jgi:hypothetical protein